MIDLQLMAGLVRQVCVANSHIALTNQFIYHVIRPETFPTYNFGKEVTKNRRIREVTRPARMLGLLQGVVHAPNKFVVSNAILKMPEEEFKRVIGSQHSKKFQKRETELRNNKATALGPSSILQSYYDSSSTFKIYWITYPDSYCYIGHTDDVLRRMAQHAREDPKEWGEIVEYSSIDLFTYDKSKARHFEKQAIEVARADKIKLRNTHHNPNREKG